MRLLIPLPAATLLPAGCTTTKMVHPAPIAVPAGVAHFQVAQAIKTALAGRGWIITSATTEHAFTATLSGDGWTATIRTPYDTKQARIEYMSSKGLPHTRNGSGTAIINRRWNWWMGYLRNDIRARLAA